MPVGVTAVVEGKRKSAQFPTMAAAPATTRSKESKAAADKKRPTYMLHEPGTMLFRGKYRSSSHRYAALKAAKTGLEEILLRQTNTKTVHKYTGKVLTLDKPRVVMRGDREIVYRKKPVATYHGSFEFTGKLDNEHEGENGSAVDADDEKENEAEPEPAPTPARSNPRPVKKQGLVAKRKTTKASAKPEAAESEV